MPDPLYQVWIHDDNESHLRRAEAYLQSKFPGVLAIRKHEMYPDVTQAIIEGGYIDFSFFGASRRERRELEMKRAQFGIKVTNVHPSATFSQ